MTRLEKAARARELRDQGLLLREIAEVMGSGISTVSTWLGDPDLSRQRRNRNRYRKPCPNCGTPMNGSNGFNGMRPSKLCRECCLDAPHTVQAALSKAVLARSIMHNRWSDEALLDALRFFHKKTGRSSYPAYRELAPDMGLPSGATIAHRFDTWNEAKRRAGLPVTVSRRHSYPRLSDASLLAAIREAGELVGGLPSRSTYDGVRRCTDLALPSGALIRIRFGGWANALAAAFGDRELEAA